MTVQLYSISRRKDILQALSVIIFQHYCKSCETSRFLLYIKNIREIKIHVYGKPLTSAGFKLRISQNIK